MSLKLSVILPVYNGMPYLPDAVESVLRQTFADFTFIIVNDGSTDGTEEYLRSLNDPRIVLINQSNEGLGASLNTGLKRCQTEYVARMDADDISIPDRFVSQLRYLEAHPEIVMVGTQIEFLIGNVAQKALAAPCGHDGIRARLLKGRAGLCHPSLMFRTAAAVACGGYPTGIIGEDIDFCLRMCERGRAANLNRVLFQYRLHAAQLCQARSRELVSFNRYAAYLSTCRRMGIPEPGFKSFVQSASFIDRCRWSIEAWELTQYRTGRILLASGKPVRGFLRLASLAVCRPLSTIRRAAQTLASLRPAHVGNDRPASS
ncbi:MAG: glycosyltransferase [Terracidiphilus sp.]|jgi:glycosyltransferase involved in cell wall biosynthesis